MSLKFFVLCATLAIARAGYLEPALKYAHAAPLAIAAPAPLTYTIPPTVRAEHLPPVVTTSYGYSTAHTPVPAPIIRAEPVHVAPAIHAAPAPLAFAGPSYHGAHLGRVALPAPIRLAAPAPLAFAGPAIHAAPAPLAFAGPAFHGAHLGRVALPAPIGLPAPAPLAFAGPALHGAHLTAPTLGFAGHLGGSHLALGRNYAAGFGFGAVPAISTGFGFGGHLGRSLVAPAPLNFAHSSYGSHF